jgi:hypothetical protein
MANVLVDASETGEPDPAVSEVAEDVLAARP